MDYPDCYVTDLVLQGISTLAQFWISASTKFFFFSPFFIYYYLYIYIFLVLLFPCGKFWLLPIPVASVCSISVCPNNGMAASVWDFIVHTDVDACSCTWGLYAHCKIVCTGLDTDGGRKMACPFGH